MDSVDIMWSYLASLADPVLDAWLAPATAAAFAPPLSPAAPAAAFPVLRHLPAILAHAPPAAAHLTARLCACAPQLRWRQTYRPGELPDRFFDNYAWTELLPAMRLDTGHWLSAGALLLGPDTVYPAHRHLAAEIYVPLSGSARWQQGDAAWRERGPGDVIHHASEESHAMQTQAEPLLALYLWHGEDLSSPARLQAATT